MRTTIIRLALLLMGPVATALAQDAKSLRPSELPDFFAHPYERSARDPYLSAAARVTLFSSAPDSRSLAVGESAQTILATILAEVRSKLRVNGIVSVNGRTSRAIISNIELALGEPLVLPVPTETWSKLAGSARTYGVEVSRIEGPDSSKEVGIVLVVSAISMDGVQLSLRGFNNPLCILPYDRRLALPRRVLAPISQ